MAPTMTTLRTGVGSKETTTKNLNRKTLPSQLVTVEEEDSYPSSSPHAKINIYTLNVRILANEENLVELENALQRIREYETRSVE